MMQSISVNVKPKIYAAVCSSVGHVRRVLLAKWAYHQCGGWWLESHSGHWIFSSKMWYRLVGRLSGFFSWVLRFAPPPPRYLQNKNLSPNSGIAELALCTVVVTVDVSVWLWVNACDQRECSCWASMRHFEPRWRWELCLLKFFIIHYYYVKRIKRISPPPPVNTK